MGLQADLVWQALVGVARDAWPWLALLFALAASGLWLRHRRRREGTLPPQPTLRPFRDDPDSHLFEMASRLEADNRHLHQLLTLLPDFVKQLSGDLDKRNIAPLLMNFVDYLFDPRKMLVLYTSPRKSGLVVTRKKGFGHAVDVGRIVPTDEGRMGWVARHQISMTAADFLSRRITPSGSNDAIKSFERSLELCVPMVHDNRLLGVIAVAELGRRPPNEKRMLRMVADLGSIALHTAALLRQAELAANSDSLTKLFNKRFLLTQLETEIIKASRSGEPLSIFFFDFDHFKNYNDVNGHQAGDEALRISGRLLTESLREDDIPARYGGEEFVVILPNTTKLGAYEAGEKIRAAVESHPYPHASTQPLGSVTISGGIASYPEDGQTVEELLEAADAALYAAKKGGRNRVLTSESGDSGSQLASETSSTSEISEPSPS